MVPEVKRVLLMANEGRGGLCGYGCLWWQAMDCSGVGGRVCYPPQDVPLKHYERSELSAPSLLAFACMAVVITLTWSAAKCNCDLSDVLQHVRTVYLE